MLAVSPASSKGKVSKRSSNSYSSEEWRRHRPLITRLYFEEGRTLKEVREHLDKEFGFAPTERMYKSRLHTWGLDKKKKEHEMLDLVRQGLQQQGDDKDKVFLVRGRQVTLADALHYFNRKGIKDPFSLLETQGEPHAEPSGDLSSPDELEVETPLSTNGDVINSADAAHDSDYELMPSPRKADSAPMLTLNLKPSDFAEKQLLLIQEHLGVVELNPMPLFRTLSIDAAVPSVNGTPAECRFLEAVQQQAMIHYRTIFSNRGLAVNTWSATSDDALADRFYFSMYHGYSFLWNGQRQRAFEDFYKAFALIEGLLKDNHVGFLVYVFDIIIRYDGTGFEEPLLLLLGHLADMAKTVFGSEEHPIYLIASWIKHADVSRAWLAEFTLRKLLDFFSDSIGYFHGETIALLQTFSFGLLNRKRSAEAALRFQQLVDAFETTSGKHSYEVCYALRCTSEAYFDAEQYAEALQALKAALERSEYLPRAEEREIYVRCLRGMAEISFKIGQRDEANRTMQHVVDCCEEAFGPDHAYTNRAKMHQKSIMSGEGAALSAIPPMVYRLGRGGSAAKYIWTTRLSPTRLQA